MSGPWLPQLDQVGTRLYFSLSFTPLCTLKAKGSTQPGQTHAKPCFNEQQNRHTPIPTTSATLFPISIVLSLPHRHPFVEGRFHITPLSIVHPFFIHFFGPPLFASFFHQNSRLSSLSSFLSLIFSGSFLFFLFHHPISSTPTTLHSSISLPLLIIHSSHHSSPFPPSSSHHTPLAFSHDLTRYRASRGPLRRLLLLRPRRKHHPHVALLCPSNRPLIILS